MLLSDSTAVEDAIQEAWVDTWRSLTRFKEEQPFRPWLLTIVANRCRMHMRRRKIPTIPIETAEEDYLISADNVLKDILCQEQEQELQAALIHLTPEQQRVLELRFFAELEFTEIALVMNVPLGTVKSRFHRAMNALRTSAQIKSLAPSRAERIL